MNISKALIWAGGVVCGASVAVFLYSFFSMYGLVGSCQNGTEHCAAYTKLVWINRAGLVLVITGGFTLYMGILMRPKR
ncbi:MAG TPA: hypothetical protein VLH86_04965 [Patescibacteria group bacterium]|nr:hypothetical protein [Patescibacteria group bacterium]